MRYSRPGNKSRWRKEPLTLKQLHDEYAKAWADQTDEPVQWEKGEEDEEKKVGWRLVETYIRESKIRPELRPDAVEVPVEADLREHGLPTLIGVLDLAQAGIIVDYKTSGQTPNPEWAVHTHEVQTSSYAVLYREATGIHRILEQGIELRALGFDLAEVGQLGADGDAVLMRGVVRQTELLRVVGFENDGHDV